jgi:plastocyanin
MNSRLEDVLKGRLTRRRLIGSGLASVATAFLAACGGGSDGGGGGGGSGGGSGGDAADADLTVKMVNITASTFKFEPAEITLQSGVEVKLLFINESGLPHSFRIDGVVDSGVIKNATSKATSTESSTLLVFTPPEPGEKMFYCSAHGPGSESGMVTIT